MANNRFKACTHFLFPVTITLPLYSPMAKWSRGPKHCILSHFSSWAALTTLLPLSVVMATSRFSSSFQLQRASCRASAMCSPVWSWRKYLVWRHADSILQSSIKWTVNDIYGSQVLLDHMSVLTAKYFTVASRAVSFCLRVVYISGSTSSEK